MLASGFIDAAPTRIVGKRAAPEASPRRSVPRYEIVRTRGPSFEEVTLAGSPDIDQLVSTLHVLGVELETRASAGVLIDLTGLQSTYGPLDLARVGREMASSFAHYRKVALVVSPQRITRISERAAQRNGVDMRVFATRPLALQWLRRSV